MSQTIPNTIEQVNALFWRKDKKGLEILLVEELEGIWSLPGGAKEPEDPSLTAAMKRELKEELGLHEQDCELQATKIQARFLYDKKGSSRYGKTGVISLFLARLNNDIGLKPSNDLKAAQWFTEQEAKERFTFEHHVDIVDRGIQLLQTH